MARPVDPAVGRVAWAHARQRSAAVIGIVLITALGCGVTFAVAAAARRTSTALDRALAEEQVADVAIDVLTLDEERLAEAAALPEVDELSAVAFTALRPAGTDLQAGIDLAGLAPLDDRAGQTMDRLQVVEGRAADPRRADEAVIDPGLAERLGIEVGDDLDLESFTQGQLEDLFVDPENVTPEGPAFTVTVVGLVRALEEVTSDNQGRFGVVGLTAEGWRAHGTGQVDEITDPEREGMGAFRLLLRARLADGPADADEFVDDLTGIFGRQTDATFSQSRPDVFAAAEDTIDVEALALALFALGAALATLFAAGQAAARLAGTSLSGDGPAMTAFGFERRQRVQVGALPAVGAAAVGALLGIPLAIAGSSIARFGLAERIEVDEGLVVDPVVLVVGTVLVVAIVGLAAFLAARAATGPSPRRFVGLAPPRWPDGAPALSMGVRTARARAWWPTAVAAVAVAGVAGVVTFGASLDRLADTPRLYGFGWDEDIVLQADGEAIAAEEGPRLVDDDRVEDLSLYRIFEISFGGDERIGGLAVEDLKGGAGPTLLAGRLPRSVDEIAVDPGALAGAGPHIGDVLRTPDLADRATLEVVGILTGTGLGEFVVGPETADRLNAQVTEGGFLLNWADDVDVDAAEAELGDRFAEVEPPRPTAEILNLRGVRSVPVALGGFFVLIGLATVGHTMVVVGRRRRGDVAVTRALGFTRRQAVAVLVGEGITIGVVGIAVGLVLGTLLGRLVWNAVADALRVIPEVAIPPLGLIAIGLGAVLLLGLMGTLVARFVVRERPSSALRAP